jgi:hypothetical protein
VWCPLCDYSQGDARLEVKERCESYEPGLKKGGGGVKEYWAVRERVPGCTKI